LSHCRPVPCTEQAQGKETSPLLDVRYGNELVDVGLQGDLNAAILRPPLRGIVPGDRVELSVPPGGEDSWGHTLRDEETNDLDSARCRKLPVRREARRLDRHVVGVPGDLEVALLERLEHGGHLFQRSLTSWPDIYLPGLEQNIVWKLKDHPPISQHDAQIACVNHHLQSQRDVPVESGSRFGGCVRSAQLLEACPRLGEGGSQRPLLGQKGVGIGAETFQLGAKLRVLRVASSSLP
jgi:hypothetical protein